jgi:hypothetical protein
LSEVVSPQGSALGHLTMDDLLVARLHDLNDLNDDTRRQWPDAAEQLQATRSSTTMSLSR